MRSKEWISAVRRQVKLVPVVVSGWAADCESTRLEVPHVFSLGVDGDRRPAQL
jgi:hypothetical protein